MRHPRAHPMARSRLSGEARDLPPLNSMFIRHRHDQPTRAKQGRCARPPKQFFVYFMTNGPKSAILIHGHHRQSPSPCLAAQEQADTGIYQPLPPDPPRLLRALLLSRYRYRSGKRNQRLAAQQENKSHRIDESTLGGPSERLGRRVQSRTSSRSGGDPSPRWKKRLASGMTPSDRISIQFYLCTQP